MKLFKAGRLAFRVEGDFWRCYWALPDTMDGAIELGAVAMAIVADEYRKAEFMRLMREFISEALPVARWNGPEPAPEAEKAGRA